jgi:branched-chain amino acid transport system ATP-binding protein
LLDEPAAGLALAERAEMMALVRQVAAQGVTVLYTEHNMDAVFGVADRVMVLMQGRLVADDTPNQVAQDPQVLKHYLGMDFKTQAQADAQADAQFNAQAKAEASVQTPSSAGGRHA